MWRNRRPIARLAAGKRPERSKRRALVTLYEPRGEFQLTLNRGRFAGPGQNVCSNASYFALKAKLEAEGACSPPRPNALPAFPAPYRHRHQPAGRRPARRPDHAARRAPHRPSASSRPGPGRGALPTIAGSHRAGSAPSRRLRRHHPVPGRRQHRRPLVVQRGTRRPRHSRLPAIPVDFRRRPRNRLHHRRLRRRPARCRRRPPPAERISPGPDSLLHQPGSPGRTIAAGMAARWATTSSAWTGWATPPDSSGRTPAPTPAGIAALGKRLHRAWATRSTARRLANGTWSQRNCSARPDLDGWPTLDHVRFRLGQRRLATFPNSRNLPSAWPAVSTGPARCSRLGSPGDRCGWPCWFEMPQLWPRRRGLT